MTSIQHILQLLHLDLYAIDTNFKQNPVIVVKNATQNTSLNAIYIVAIYLNLTRLSKQPQKYFWKKVRFGFFSPNASSKTDIQLPSLSSTPVILYIQQKILLT
tara:strand:+ start:5690 stop:5998 length:309 start_codon:yes stop_codon:yes gene_type:complete